ncbi:AAA family ATPase [Thalassobacillus pellis]|uniref:AAA family ATPase n=1 Tax=Thalassobacillus pellis TaxID=748008 RepID=UPI0019610F9E|nr:AAA family ATPase [Thalassobacillus pellis]MBM7552592.1 putative ATPase [Thalassobacillus pellis]
MLLKSITYLRTDNDCFPFNLEILKSFESLTFKSPVTILVGENGTGKSTLLEAIAANANSIHIGKETNKAALHLGNRLKLSWKYRTNKGFDEPEVPLSPMKQLSFLSLLKEMTREEAQFIIATHSPMIMAFPNATIISLDSKTPTQVIYEELEHVQITRSFLESPERYLRHL